MSNSQMAEKKEQSVDPQSFQLQLTDKAVEKIKEYQEKMTEAKDKLFRVYVQGGGCSGFSYGFIFDAKRDDDFQMPAKDITYLVDPQSAMYLSGCTVDFVESLS